MPRIIRDAIALLNRLIQLDRSAIDAYKAVMVGLGDSVELSELALFLGDHRRHVDELAFLVRNLGGEPASQGDLRRALVRGPMHLRGELGAGIDLLQGTETEALATYEDAASQPGIPVDVLAVLERGVRDERRHHSWICARALALSAASSSTRR